MKADKINSIFSIAIIIGSITGFICSVDYIIANKYIQYNMFRLICFSFQKLLNKWIVLTIIISFVLLVALKLLTTLQKRTENIFILITNNIDTKGKNGPKTILLVGIVCCLFFVYTGWYINHYWLPDKFHPLSLLADLGILLFTLLLGYALTKIKWERLTRFKEAITIIAYAEIFTKRVKTIKRTALALFLLIVVFNLVIVIYCKIKIPEGPNVLLIVVDALRADSLGCYNNMINQTPNMDIFAKNAVLFKNAIAQSSCTINSVPSIFCSVYPSEHGYYNYNSVIPYRLNTLAEFLKNAGYKTFAISTNPHVTSRNRLDQGFDIFIEDLVWKDSDCNEVNDKFIKWLNNNRKRFFGMLWFVDPHSPYDPPPEYMNKYILTKKGKELVHDKTKMKYKDSGNILTEEEKIVSMKLYNAEVNFFDTEFAKLLNYLKQNGLIKNTIIIVTSDHGESFWEKKNLMGEKINDHGNSLYVEQITIPLIISIPNQKKGKVVYSIVSHIDIVPTILEYTNNKIADSLFLRGISLKRLINGKKLKRRHIYSQLITDQYGPYQIECVQSNNIKLIRTIQYEKLNFAPPNFQLFNLEQNESEIDLTSNNNKKILQDLQNRLRSWPNSLMKKKHYFRQNKYSDIKEEKLKERLKSLGYIK
jgi:arylsulfatase A-like enzyme